MTISELTQTFPGCFSLPTYDMRTITVVRALYEELWELNKIMNVKERLENSRCSVIASALLHESQLRPYLSQKRNLVCAFRIHR